MIQVGHKACIWCRGTPLLHLWLATCKLTCKTRNAAQLTMRCLKPSKHGLIWWIWAPVSGGEAGGGKRTALHTGWCAGRRMLDSCHEKHYKFASVGLGGCESSQACLHDMHAWSDFCLDTDRNMHAMAVCVHAAPTPKQQALHPLQAPFRPHPPTPTRKPFQTSCLTCVKFGTVLVTPRPHSA